MSEPTARRITDPGELVRAAAPARSLSTQQAGALLADPSAVAIGGFIDGEPVGYIVSYLVRRIDGLTMLIVYDVEVAPDSQRRGVGAAMVQEALRVARSAAASKAWVITDKANDAAMGLYRSTGAVESPDDDLVMVWDL